MDENSSINTSSTIKVGKNSFVSVHSFLYCSSMTMSGFGFYFELVVTP